MVDRDRDYERHTGNDSLLKWNGENGLVEVPVTTKDWSRDETHEEIQHDGSLNPTLTTTELRYSGSFEYTGQHPDVLEEFFTYDEEDGIAKRGTLSVREFNHDTGAHVVTYTFHRVKANSVSRDNPSDGTSSTTVDWDAENMTMERFDE
jgi:hypothetical protein